MEHQRAAFLLVLDAWEMEELKNPDFTDPWKYYVFRSNEKIRRAKFLEHPMAVAAFQKMAPPGIDADDWSAGQRSICKLEFLAMELLREGEEPKPIVEILKSAMMKDMRGDDRLLLEG